MYTLLIVEDEEEIREGIRAFLEEEIHFFTIETAKNGAKALERISSGGIDAMILDIRMPVMDGVTLLSELQKEGISITTVILSGHDEFEYAKMALEYGAAKYVLKPVTPEDVLQVAEELKTLLDEKRHRIIEVEQLREQVRQNMNMLKERFFNDIVSGRVDKDTFRNKIEYFNMNIVHGSFRVAVIDTPCNGSFDTIEDHEILKQFLENVLNEFAQSHDDTNVFRITSEQMVLLFDLPGAYNQDCIVNRLARIKKEIEESTGMDITIGIGRVHEGIEGIKKSYLDAVSSLKHKIIMGSGSILCYWDINTVDQISEITFDIEEFKLNLKLCMKEQVKSSIINILDAYAENGRKSRLDNIYAYSNFVVASSASALSELGKSIQELFHEHTNPFTAVYGLHSIEEVKAWLISLTDKCMDFISELREGKSQNVVEMAKKIICENFKDDINTKYLSEILYMNQDYLGRIFKANTGLAVNDYLNKVRINKAKELFKESNLMVYEVAHEVGFNDHHYFSTVFKKITGVTPSKYKEI